jgi:hypothetical protein
MHKGELGVPMIEDTHRYRQLTRDRTKSAAGQSFISNVQTQTHQGHINKRKHKSEEISSLHKKNKANNARQSELSLVRIKAKSS